MCAEAADHIYIREPGRYGYIDRKLSSDGFNMVRDQLHLLRDQYLSGNPYPSSHFAYFLRFPLVAGYVLGIEEGIQTRRNIRLSELEILASVMRLDSLYSNNQLDMEISTHFSMQQAIFRLGVEVGGRDVSGNYGLTLLALIGQLFLKYPDPKIHALMLPQFLEAWQLDHLVKLVPDYIRRWQHHLEYAPRH